MSPSPEHRGSRLELVPRADLISRIPPAEDGGVVLICAPAGSGKTVLVRSWARAAGLERQLAWFSVDRGERDTQRFWIGLIDALADALDEVKPVAPAPEFGGAAIIDQLRDQLDLLESRAVLVIDDLHELRSPDALALLNRFLSRLAPRLLVVLVTREDPRLGLHRLRLTGELTELRAADLRFSRTEAEQLLGASGVTLSPEALTRLCERTEGWVAGLRLAAITLAQHPDPERFVAEFSGSERMVAGYLLDEVLDRQTPQVCDLLLRTSILDVVTGPLADHLLGISGSESILQELEDANAFVTSQDASRTRFRYHHLFADLLRLELRRRAPDSVRPLHLAAAAWLEQQGEFVEAIRHAQAAREWSRAAGILSRSRVRLILDGHSATMRALLDGFPAGIARDDPEVALSVGGVLASDGRRAEAAAHLLIAERNSGRIADEHRQLFDLELANIQLELARQKRDLTAAHTAMTALDAALGRQSNPEIRRASEVRALALLNLAATQIWSMSLEEASRNLQEGLAMARRLGRPYLEIGYLAHLAIATPLMGRSATEALRLAEDAVSLAEEHGLVNDPIVVLAFAVGGGSLALLGRFDEAERWLERAGRTMLPDGDPVNEIAVHHARGLQRSGQGRLEEAVAAFRHAGQVQSLLSGRHAHINDVLVEGIITLTRMGRFDEARTLLQGIPEEDLGQAWALVPAGALQLAEGHPEAALELLAPVIDGSAPVWMPGSTWPALWALLFDAAARWQLGEFLGAEESLEQALDLAEVDGLILPFLITPVRELVERHPRHRTKHAALITAIEDVRAGASPRSRREPGELADELSEAELRVVRYLPSNLRASEIASELVVSTNTVRTHLRHIYAKLGAHTRSEAVTRARELGLLAPSAGHRR